MTETVLTLDEVFRDEARRRVAVVADGDGAVRALEPAAVLLLHHMAVRARAWIVRQVGPAARIEKGIAGQGDGGPEGGRGDDRQEPQHLGCRTVRSTAD